MKDGKLNDYWISTSSWDSLEILFESLLLLLWANFQQVPNNDYHIMTPSAN